MGFMHRRLHAYDRAIELVVKVYAATERLTFRWRSIVDQVRRSAVSIPLNIAEGVSETSARDQSRFLRIARRSAAECDAAFHILHATGAITDDVARDAEGRLNQIGAMLTGLIKRSDARIKAPEPRSSGATELRS